ncbi:hypothetical protein [Pseudonocardia humida]|uniref:Uncharacterized protein n=1 Tax=Pseudonocardia humida TaxID=2800819 RepID=A0ABT0ZWM0_9PSEU|nr:hypothetical protein [Pseudonocardia humida]MCO1655140.1 hypothetical protein [Pseudonocardia humida]
MGVLVRRAAASVVVASVVAAAAVALPGAASAAPAAERAFGTTQDRSPELGVEATGGVIDGGSGYAIVDGIVSCTEAVAVRVSGSAVQFSTGAFGMFDALVDCAPGGPVAWDAVLPHLTDAPFEPGEVGASTRASVVDPDDGSPVGAEQSTTVTLTFALTG